MYTIHTARRKAADIDASRNIMTGMRIGSHERMFTLNDIEAWTIELPDVCMLSALHMPCIYIYAVIVQDDVQIWLDATISSATAESTKQMIRLLRNCPASTSRMHVDIEDQTRQAYQSLCTRSFPGIVDDPAVVAFSPLV